MTDGDRSEPRIRLLLFVAWAAVGLVAAAGVASLLTIGVLFLVIAGAVAALLAWRGKTGGGTPIGLGLGVAAVIGYIGWLNRGGPGTVCHAVNRGTDCRQEWSPWPFAIVAVLVAAATVVLFLRTSWSERRR